MEKDFYLDDRGLAAYFEKDWMDHISEQALTKAFTFAPFSKQFLYSNYHEQLINLVAAQSLKLGHAPASLLEVGSSLGRTYFEACLAFKSLKIATLVEPSKNLYKGFQKIFVGREAARFAVLKGFTLSHEIIFDTAAIRAACARVEVTTLPFTFQELNLSEKFDLVICSNVIDQCKDPRELAEVLKGSTSPGGVLVLSCTYQWQNKYTGNAARLIHDINALFGPGWRPLVEANIPFQVRANERHWLQFLSHAVIYRNTSGDLRLADRGSSVEKSR